MDKKRLSISVNRFVNKLADIPPKALVTKKGMLSMAAITPNKKDGKIISYRFRSCVGRNTEGKQVFRSMTWNVPAGLTPSKAEKAAQKAAERWESEVRAEYQQDLQDPQRVKDRQIDREKTDFAKKSLQRPND